MQEAIYEIHGYVSKVYHTDCFRKVYPRSAERLIGAVRQGTLHMAHRHALFLLDSSKFNATATCSHCSVTFKKEEK